MTRDELLNRKTLTKSIEVAELGTLSIKKLTQADVEKCRKDFTAEDKRAAGLRFVVVKGLVDNDGKRIFTDAELDKVGELDFEIVKTLAEEIADFSGLVPPKTAESASSATTQTDSQS